jgi:predicted NAD/FAD-dependent oxidoreductase/deoxyribodipyrimidine photolyase
MDTPSLELPHHLARRVVRDASPRGAGGLVVVWLRVAVRGHENPALDVGRRLAVALGKPLLVYHAVSERYPHASDRHHTFILEGARDMVAELDALGLASACHVERPGHRGPVLRELAARSAVVVADAMPLDPLRGWTERLGAHAPVIEVDASCLAPMHVLGTAPTRAFAFRKASASYRDPVGWPWPLETSLPERYEGPLPFEPVDLRVAQISELVGACAIDHSVAPVADTRGGAVAGYRRWAAFRDGPLSRYAWLRNDAAKHYGVSRMSAYLHYGHVSPFRIAREADERGAEKYLDELLTWREMAWHTCFHQREPRGVQQLPSWARETLAEQGEAPRKLLPLETLESGATGERLWDLAQRSLVLHGELHNNVRMTWGKAVLQWSRGPRQALARLYELNDRYALDGRDPSSVGGIQWCFGAQDRPFNPPAPLYGSVRSRSVTRHADRLDLDAYAAHVGRRVLADARVLVVGAGMAGAAAASLLHRYGVDVTVVDKARGPGGRLSSRRSALGRYDHGAQSFTARDPRFLRQVRIWEAAGVVTRWTGALGAWDGKSWTPDEPRTERWVATPRMSVLPGHILGDVPLSAPCRVTGLHRAEQGLEAQTESNGLGRFDHVLVTAPAPQAADLVATAAPGLAERLRQVQVQPCWAGMVAGPLDLPFDAGRVGGAPLQWLARQDTLPGRAGEPRWVVHASPEWSLEHLDDEAEEVAERMRDMLGRLVGGTIPEVTAHRWRYARVMAPLGVDLLEDRGVLVAGDACGGPRVEQAWLSGVAAAGSLLRTLARPRDGRALA